MGTLPVERTDQSMAREVSWEDLEVRMISRPFLAASVRDKLLLLLIKALMGASNTAGF
jgi:hypothetical protein